MTTDDLKALRVPLIWLALALAVTAGAIYYTHMLRLQAQAVLTHQQSLLRDAQMRMQRSGDEEAIIVQYVSKYRQLQQSGFIGDERRINWLDALRIANERTELFGVNYEIGVQQPYPAAAELNPGQIRLRQSAMKLDFQLLHEGDLLRFFETLRAQGKGLFQLDQCNLRRTDSSDTLRYQPNIKANCQLMWITATPDAPGAQP